MDVMVPELIWIDGKCYRCRAERQNPTFEEQKEMGLNWEDMDSNFMCKEDCDAEFDSLIEVASNGTCKLRTQISKTFWSFIIGSRGVTKKRIESDTRTGIYIPRQAQQGDIVISGTCKRDVILAKRNIDSIIHSALQKLPFTHFVSIPMCNSEIMYNYNNFKEKILSNFSNMRGIDETIFQTPEKLHLTLAPLVLTDEMTRKVACEKLKEVCSEVIQPLMTNRKPCIVEMKGIEYMNDDPYDVDVIYGRVRMIDNSDLLNQITNAVISKFDEQGVVRSRDKNRDVKLHVTLLNTVFRGDKPEEDNGPTTLGGKSRRERKKRETFDASLILKELQDYYFGREVLKTLHISLRFSGGDDGYYVATCKVDL